MKLNYTVDYHEIPLNKNGSRCWPDSVGKNVYIVFKDKIEILTILEYNRPYIKFLYHDFVYERAHDTFQLSDFDFLFTKPTLGSTFYLKTGPVKFINKIYKKTDSNTMTYYLCRCKTCGQLFQANPQYLNENHNCSVCIKRKVVRGYNSISDTNPEMAKYFADSTDAYRYVDTSDIKIKCICPDCGEELWIAPRYLKNYGFFCSNCTKRKMSYAETFMFTLLLQVFDETEIENEKTFDWALSYKNAHYKLRYDFYIKPLNCIIEVQGPHHYKQQTQFKISLDQVKKNDLRKLSLAKSNHISNYITFKAIYSQFNYLVQHVLENQKLIELFNSMNLDLEKQDKNFWNKIKEKTNQYYSSQKKSN